LRCLATATGTAVVFWQEYRADTVLSLLITLLVAHSGWRILSETSAVLLDLTPYGGTQRVVVWLARGLAELGHRVTVLAPAGSFYAYEPWLRLGLADSAALRVGLAPYSDAGDATRLVDALRAFVLR